MTMRRIIEDLLTIRWPLGWAAGREGGACSLVLAIGRLLAVLGRLLLTISGRTVDERLRLVGCGTCHRPTPRHATPEMFADEGSNGVSRRKSVVSGGMDKQIMGLGKLKG